MDLDSDVQEDSVFGLEDESDGFVPEPVSDFCQLSTRSTTLVSTTWQSTAGDRSAHSFRIAVSEIALKTTSPFVDRLKFLTYFFFACAS